MCVVLRNCPFEPSPIFLLLAHFGPPLRRIVAGGTVRMRTRRSNDGREVVVLQFVRPAVAA
jgi:hypothetical protein